MNCLKTGLLLKARTSFRRRFRRVSRRNRYFCARLQKLLTLDESLQDMCSTSWEFWPGEWSSFNSYGVQGGAILSEDGLQHVFSQNPDSAGVVRCYCKFWYQKVPSIEEKYNLDKTRTIQHTAR
jgi:hypothetical protein